MVSTGHSASLWDMSGLGGATSRIEVMQAQRRIQELQEILVETMLDRVKNLAIAHAIASNQLPATKNWKRGRFTFGAWLTADVGYQTQSDMMLISDGHEVSPPVGCRKRLRLRLHDRRCFG